MPSHTALFSPRQLRSRKPRKQLHSMLEESAWDSDDEISSDNTILDLCSPTKIPPRSSGIPSVDDRTIDTPTLVQLGLVYNVKYNVLICVECQSGISLTGVPIHAYEGVIQNRTWDEKRRVWTAVPGQKHSQPKIMKSQKRAYSAPVIQERVLQELESHLNHPVSPLKVPEASLATRMDWITKVALPHPDQKGPIAGLRVFKNAFKCTTGSCQSANFPYFCLVADCIRSHGKIQHPGIKTSYAEGYTVQTMTLINQAFTFFFEVTEIKAQVLPLNLLQKQVNQADIIHEERQRLLGSLEKSRGLDHDLIHEAFGDVGMKKFWALLNMEVIAPLYKSGTITREDKLLRTAVVATFFDITRCVGDANPALLHLIAKGAL